MHRNRYHLLAIVALAATVALVLWYPTTKVSPATTITLTENGFEPKEISIKQGETVRFVSQISDREYWPASDSHPTHNLLSSFDPERALQSGEAWEFTFDTLGSWEFHDHLYSTFKGTITVYSEYGETTANCVKRGEENSLLKQDECWVEEFHNVYKELGEEAMFAVIDTYVQNDEMFNRNCHDTMHGVGDFIYDTYKETGDPILHPGTSYCGYGFYHGFIERMIEEEGSYTASVQYCERIAEDPRHLAPGYGQQAQNACQHGFGHSLFDTLPGTLWGDIDAMVGKNLTQCSELFPEEPAHFQCATGVFNALMLALANNWYELSYDLILDDPYRLCRETTDFYKPACYIDMVVHHTYWAKTPHEEVFATIRDIKHDQSRHDTLEAFTSNVLQRELSKSIEDRYEFARNCFDVTETAMQMACFSGIHHGIFQRTNQYTNQAESQLLCDRFDDATQKEVCESTILKRDYEAT